MKNTIKATNQKVKKGTSKSGSSNSVFKGSELENIFENRVAPTLKVKSRGNSSYNLKPKKDIYKLEHDGVYGYSVRKQNKGGTSETSISQNMSKKEMRAYLSGMEDGANIRTKNY